MNREDFKVLWQKINRYFFTENFQAKIVISGRVKDLTNECVKGTDFELPGIEDIFRNELVVVTMSKK